MQKLEIMGEHLLNNFIESLNKWNVLIHLSDTLTTDLITILIIK